jgi:hypothetical protein
MVTESATIAERKLNVGKINMLKLNSQYCFIKKDKTSRTKWVEFAPIGFIITSVKEAQYVKSKVQGMKKLGYSLAEVQETVELLCSDKIPYEILEENIDTTKLDLGNLTITL